MIILRAYVSVYTYHDIEIQEYPDKASAVIEIMATVPDRLIASKFHDFLNRNPNILFYPSEIPYNIDFRKGLAFSGKNFNEATTLIKELASNREEAYLLVGMKLSDIHKSLISGWIMPLNALKATDYSIVKTYFRHTIIDAILKDL